MARKFLHSACAGQPGGVAVLDETGRVPTGQLPASQGGGEDSVAQSKAESASVRASAADSKAVSVSVVDSAGSSVSGSRAVSNASNASIASSRGDSASVRASTADSRALSVSALTSTADSKGVSAASLATSQNTSQSSAVSVADSKAVSAAAAGGGGGGSDPWTYVKLASDFTTSLATAQDVGLSFTPEASQSYIFEAVIGVRSATATVNPRPGLAWATGMLDGVATIEQTSTATAKVMANGNIAASLLLAVGGIPSNSASWPALVYGWVRAGGAPSGTVRIQLASETAGTVVRVVAGSYIRWRAY